MIIELKAVKYIAGNVKNWISKLEKKFEKLYPNYWGNYKKIKIMRRIMKWNTGNKINLIGIPEWHNKGERRKTIFKEVLGEE